MSKMRMSLDISVVTVLVFMFLVLLIATFNFAVEEDTPKAAVVKKPTAPLDAAEARASKAPIAPIEPKKLEAAPVEVKPKELEGIQAADAKIACNDLIKAETGKFYKVDIKYLSDSAFIKEASGKAVASIGFTVFNGYDLKIPFTGYCYFNADSSIRNFEIQEG